MTTKDYFEGILNRSLDRDIRSTFLDNTSFTVLLDKLQAALRNVNNDLNTLVFSSGDWQSPRFLSARYCYQSLRTIFTFLVFAPGIPSFYYGDEQFLKGETVPYNRELLWPHLNQYGGAYQKLRKLLKIREKHKTWQQSFTILHADAHTLIFARGRILVALSNKQNHYLVPEVKLPYPERTLLKEIFTRETIWVPATSRVVIPISPNGARVYKVYLKHLEQS